MIDSHKVNLYLDNPANYGRDLPIDRRAERPDGVCLDNAHTRIFIDTINLIHATNPAVTVANSMNRIDGFNVLWDINGAITPNVICNQITHAPVPYNGHTPLDRFLYLLKYEYRGYFEWNAGTNADFRRWLANPNAAATLAERDQINCWEIVLYAAVIAHLVPKATVVNAYNNPPRVGGLPAGSPMYGLSVQQALGAQSTAGGFGGVVQGTKTVPVVPPQVGDIIFEPLYDAVGGDDTMHHVFVIIALAAGGDFQNHTAMNLWGSFAGGIPEPVAVGHIMDFAVNVYRSVRLG